uniref:Uncharacterized protein n=1 Tax=Timema monikensis TaxID=170555 RepID=A0A7R9HSV7_9NEOP|nr:unnamed protein product [Timema monikensis]
MSWEEVQRGSVYWNQCRMKVGERGETADRAGKTTLTLPQGYQPSGFYPKLYHDLVRKSVQEGIYLTVKLAQPDSTSLRRVSSTVWFERERERDTRQSLPVCRQSISVAKRFFYVQKLALETHIVSSELYSDALRFTPTRFLFIRPRVYQKTNEDD